MRVLVSMSHSLAKRLAEQGPQFLEVAIASGTGEELLDRAYAMRAEALVIPATMAEGLVSEGVAWTSSRRDASTLILCLHPGLRVARAVFEVSCAYALARATVKDVARVLGEVHPQLCRRAKGAWSPESDRSPRGVISTSPRERQVLALIAQEKTTKEIAGILRASPRTIDAHRRSLMFKLGVHGLAGLVRIAVSDGLVAPSPRHPPGRPRHRSFT